MKHILSLLFSVLLLLGFAACQPHPNDAEQYFGEGTRLFQQDKKYNEAAEQFLRALSLQDEGKPTPLLARTYEYISKVYWEQDYADDALRYALQGLFCAEQLHNDSLLMQLLNRVASSYYLTESLDTACIYYDRLRQLAIQANDSLMVASACNNTGAVLLSLEKPEEALEQFQAGQRYSRQRQVDKFKYHYNLSRAYQNTQQWEACTQEIRLCMEYIDTFDVEGLQNLYERLYKCEKSLHNLEYACICADSAYLLADSASQLKQREKLQLITDRYQQEKHDAELRLIQTHWILFVVILLLLSTLFIIVLMYRHKKRLLTLQQRMEKLKMQIHKQVEQRDKPCDEEGPSIWTPEQQKRLTGLYAQQCLLARDLFRSRPAYNHLRQLRYHTDKNYLSDPERLPLIDSVTEVFLDPMQSLRTSYPDLTADECLYAILVFVGCSNADISILTKTSEPTLRKRRSRFKQKTSEQTFSFLIEKKGEETMNA